ncbi:restriction endonuclease [Sulfitobacter donghicola]|uniref:Restriction endonuclease n=1 Tax=Sulfitobacter donghicola DSW-25 = KCTC 12864 = JCM 14565 TaxID=1300350 RepID=A0A073IZG8_9RHOB|nr:restriction endonuclease [Sulfitobacter donghicola]KEJ90817.1 restriction endonuclease [Sulfitobacter donghicola DSW-25 = KCTC 12864 = JCM 14565]KIN68093.1 Restriction endonuclease [Sulfitobacter donghicola DSW-25 = KCTC 12864 = JCM 14565]
MSRTFEIGESGFPDLAGMMLITIQALKEMGGSAAISELDEKVAELEGCSEEEQSYMMSDGNSPRLNYYLAWSRTYLKKGGALENSTKGVWSLTSAGSNVTSYQKSKHLYDLVLADEREKAREKRQAKNKSLALEKVVVPQDVSESKNTPDRPSELTWDEVLLSVLRKMDPSAFERLAQRLLREAGFTKVEVRGKSGDGGIDGVGVLRVNLVSFQVYFQCKRYKGGVAAGEIRDFRGAMQGRADKGLFITTGHYTAQARDEATRDGATALDLIDGPRLCELLKENGLGVSTKMVEQVHIDTSWFEGI